MEVTVLKLVVTPSLMLGVSAASRRWGNVFAGLVSGLPLTSAPVSAFLAVEQGTRFAAASAAGSVGGMGAVMASYLAYLAASRRAGAGVAAVVALAAFLGAALWLGRPGRPVWALALVFAVLAVLVLGLARGRERAAERTLVPPRWDMAARVGASTAMLLLVTVAAPVLGPAVTGVLAPVPVISWPLIAFAHAQGGRGQAVAVIAGTTRTSFGILAFYAAVVRLVETHAVLAYAAGVAAAVGCAAPWFWLELRRRGGEGRTPAG